jgi:hypothetical protein
MTVFADITIVERDVRLNSDLIGINTDEWWKY